MTGLSWGNDFDSGRLTLGGFFEYGNGSYDTYNSLYERLPFVYVFACSDMEVDCSFISGLDGASSATADPDEIR
jgi:hypothetical protein